MKRTLLTIALPIILLLLAVVVALSVLGACGSDEPEATPTPTKTPTPAVAAQAPTNTPMATATPVPPTATPTPAAQSNLLPAQLRVSGDIVYARSAPSLDAEQVGALVLGDVVDVIERSADGAWYRICCVAGEQAWMAAEFLEPVGNEWITPQPSPAPPTPTPTPPLLAEPTTNGVNARKGPSTSYGKIGQLFTGDSLEVLGKNESGTWYKLCCVNGEQAWVAAEFLSLSGDAASVPVVEAPPLTAETQSNLPIADAGPSSSGFVSVGNVVPEVDTPPPGKYWGLCGLNVNRPPREVPPERPPISGNINPLTGLPTDPALLQRRILLVRYGNEPAIKAYYGLSTADLVFEELMDNMNTTRFTTVWLAGDAPMVGPLRSYRSTTIQLAQMYNAPIASSGAVGPNQVIAYASGVEDLDWRCYTQPYFMNPNVPSDDWQNRAVSSIPRLRAYLEANGLDKPASVRPFAFSETPPAGGRPANSVVIPYINRSYYEVEWRYDPDTGRYARFQGTNRFPLMDGNNGQQVTAANVVIMVVQHDLTDIIEDSLGSRSVRTYITEREGRAIVARDGLAFEGRWQVPDKWDNLELADEAGNPLPLKPGNTWFQIVPPSYQVTIR